MINIREKKNVRKSVGTVVMIGMSALALAACGQKADAANTQKISVSINAELQTLDPDHIVETTGGEITKNVEEGLTTIGKNTKPQPGIAKSWTKSKDGLTYTFHLRHNAKWNDGSALTAKDFVYAWQRGVNPKTKAENAYRFSGVKNADAISAGKMSVDKLGVSAKGKYTFVVQLEHPIATLIQQVSNGVFLPLQQKTVEKYGAKYGTDARYVAYDGPYTIKKWNGTGDSWTLVKNPEYWNKGNIHLTSVTYQVVKEATTGLNMFESGQLDQTTLLGNQIQNEKNNKSYVKSENGANYFIQLNQKSPSSDAVKKAFNNAKIRKAISLVINRKSFVKNTLDDGSIAAKGIVTEGMAQDPKTGEDFAKEAYVKSDIDSGVNYNLKLAKKLWAEGMKEIGQTSLNVTLTADDDDAHTEIVQYMQNQWQKELKGMHVTIKKVPKPTRVKDLQSGTFDIIMSGWSPDAGDPASFLDMFTTGNTYNFGSYSNAEYDKQMKIADTTGSDQIRWDAMVKAEKIIMADQGIVPLYQLSTSYLRNTNLKGIINNPAGGDPGWRGVSLK
ncbi:MAG: peptide ABC transporter substrate-binding protein [Lacticaseibacillus songhuajiangensis]|jgi:oligopeptide transport system substrate-binding protein|nr:peptide ABC transporter substrate-binding protein [Lacticaseibacillus songhuajiangensis]